MKTVNFSVVHWGPIKYFGKLWQALTYARNCINRGGFYYENKWIKLKSGDSLTVFRINEDTFTDAPVQIFTKE